VTMIQRVGVLAILALGALGETVSAAPPVYESFGFVAPLYRMPVTRGYQISADYSPVQVAALVAQFIPFETSCPMYGQFGIPPVYTAGQNVMVRALPEVHDRVAKYVTELGVRAPKPTE